MFHISHFSISSATNRFDSRRSTSRFERSRHSSLFSLYSRRNGAPEDLLEPVPRLFHGRIYILQTRKYARLSALELARKSSGSSWRGSPKARACRHFRDALDPLFPSRSFNQPELVQFLPTGANTAGRNSQRKSKDVSLGTSLASKNSVSRNFQVPSPLSLFFANRATELASVVYRTPRRSIRKGAEGDREWL